MKSYKYSILLKKISLSLSVVCLTSVKASSTVDVILGQTARLPCKYSPSGSTLIQWFIVSAFSPVPSSPSSPSIFIFNLLFVYTNSVYCIISVLARSKIQYSGIILCVCVCVRAYCACV